MKSARNYIVITPLGSEPGPRWAVPGGLEYGVDDLGYLSAALDTVEDSLCVDRNREFAAGFSAGAAMAQALSCTMPWRMAGIAASGGSNLTDLCPESAGTDVMILHGSADPIAPLSGSKVAFAPPEGLSVDEVVATNAGWTTNSNLTTLVAATLRCTFPLAANSKDAALYVTLDAGSYTVGVTSTSKSSGTVLFEAYSL